MHISKTCNLFFVNYLPHFAKLNDAKHIGEDFGKIASSRITFEQVCLCKGKAVTRLKKHLMLVKCILIFELLDETVLYIL